MRILIQGGTIVNEGQTFYGSILIEDEKIIHIIKGTHAPEAIMCISGSPD